MEVGKVCEVEGRLKGDTAAEVDGVRIDLLKAGGNIVLEWLVYLFSMWMKGKFFLSCE